MASTPKSRTTHAGAATAPPAATRQHDAYPLKTVAKLTGLTPDLIRAWERRYQVVSPVRGPRGARLYDADDVAHLRALGTLVTSGRAIGDVAALTPQQLQQLAEEGSAPAQGGKVAASGLHDETLARVVVALQRFDSAEVESLLGESMMVLGIQPFIAHIGVPLLERIGEMWRTGELSVAEEHVASATIRSLFGGLIRMRMPRRPPSLLLTSPAGERHELGLSMVALLCLQAGLAVAYTGVDLPAEDILSAQRKTQAPVVGLSVVSSANRANAVEQIRRLEKGLPQDVELWLGGSDAAEVARALGRTRAFVLQSLPAIETELARIAAYVHTAAPRS